MEINGKKVVVIGGASGMGRASAELLAARGASVAILDREGSDGKDVATALGARFMRWTSPTSPGPRKPCRLRSTIWAVCM
ncbi:short chain dehydrogenase family protein [Mycobacterium xenopi 4042]|uniref:Short chain dehydrogenase family protein n=1 Tax=Mycobacterium xenopi 4042 TaxID=1299334 RepID=X7Z4D3_MYCXE|nr:short chain dehydrogenase family protein [Mycobacterium xenopi 4042]EUA33838.1 short chain dehydrogenase family protein [Mycobacterium xenopi 3993]